MYRILYDETKVLKKDKTKILRDAEIATKIRQKIEILSENPLDTQLNTKLLQPKYDKKYRLKVRGFRVIYSIDTGNKIVLIHRIAKREDIYKD